MSSELAPLNSASIDGDATFQLLFYGNPLAMWVFDSETLQILAVNDPAIAQYGWSRAEFQRMTTEDLRPPEDEPEVRAYREKVRQEPAARSSQTLRQRHWTKDGTILEVESTWMEIPFRGGTGVLVINMDRTALIQAEERARGQAAMLDLASDAIMVRDLDHRVVFWSRGAEQLYGWLDPEIAGEPVTELFVKDRSAFDEALSVTLENGEWIGAMEEKRKDGREVFVNSRWTLIREADQKPQGVLVINTDITEARQLEKQFLRAQRLEAIGTLASGIAHDLNNILSPIMMAVGMLRRDVQEAGDEEMLNIIETSAARGAGVVKQVLTFARGVEGERLALQPKHLLAELSRIMAQTFPRSIEIRTEFMPDLWQVMGDATQLHQVLLNLCVNARDAILSPPAVSEWTAARKLIDLRVQNVEVDEHFASMNPGAQLGPHVVISVADTGSGISAETIEKIFDPFFTTKEPGKGTGLGLATVVGIVKSHGGFLTVKSELGQGTSFKIFLPAVPDSKGDDAFEQDTPLVEGDGQLILVVDDEAAIRDALVHTLESRGYRCYTAEDGSDALALYFDRRGEIDVVLTDLSMTQLDGIELVSRLRRVNPHVRAIVSSGHMQKEQQEILRSLGVKYFLDKPYSADKLLRALHSILAEPSGELNPPEHD
ncbi:MAG: PAS domain S-box protein [Chthoniobacteraceae bacterium]